MNFTHWKNHFFDNKSHFNHIDWKEDYTLTEKERKAISSSLQQFQKGESSEGKNLILSAQEFTKNQKDKSYVDSINLFIQEEQSHSEALWKIMHAHNIPKIEDHWIDKIFRSLRKGSNIERAILVLSCAEIIATEYYCALREATNSKTIKAVCKQILIDEEYHINFQAYALSCVYRDRNFIQNCFSRAIHFGLLLPTIGLVYLLHFGVFKSGKLNIFQLTKGCFIEFARLHSRTIQHLCKPIEHKINTQSLQYESLF